MKPALRTSRALVRAGSLVLCLGAVGATQEPVEEPILEAQVHTVQDLVRFVQQRERSVTKLEMAMESTGAFPDGSSFKTHGTLRVLGTTHFASRMQAEFGEGMTAETETVRTPEGIRMRERDPVQGEVFLAMDQALMERVDGATAALGGDANPSGFSSREARSPLGSAILEDLDRQFQLSLREPVAVGDERCWVVGGPLKADASATEDPLGLGADQVDVLVRTRDGVVVRMTQLKNGRPLLEVKITKLELDGPFDASSFVLDVPPKTVFVDVMEHPPARAQIDRLFADAKEHGWTDPANPAPATEDTSRKDGQER